MAARAGAGLAEQLHAQLISASALTAAKPYQRGVGPPLRCRKVSPRNKRTAIRTSAMSTYSRPAALALLVLTKRYDRPAGDGLDLSVYGVEFYSLLGPN